MSELFSSLPSSTQSSLDASLFGSLGGASSSTDPAIEGLDELGQSYADELSSFQSELAPQTGASDPLGSLLGGAGSTDPATQLEQELAGLLGSGTGAETADDAFLADGLPAPTYGSSGLLLAESGLFGSSGLDFYA